MTREEGWKKIVENNYALFQKSLDKYRELFPADSGCIWIVSSNGKLCKINSYDYDSLISNIDYYAIPI